MSGTSRRVLIIGADGLRPDTVDPELMPTFERVMQQGTRLADHHAVFPPHTRVNVSSLASGTVPGRHGVVANVFRTEGATDDGIIDTSDYRHLWALDGASGGPAVLAPTLGDILDRHDYRLAVAATSSPGAGILWTRNQPYRVVNTNSDYGRADLYSLREKLGPIPPDGLDHRFDRLMFAARAVTDLYLDDPEIKVIAYWMSEPDASQHYFGLGSPEARESLRACDDALAHILDGLDRRGIRDQFDIFLISDHGHSTVQHHRSLAEYLQRARTDLTAVALPQLEIASDYIYPAANAERPSADDLAPLVGWLQQQPWAGVVFGGTPELAKLPGVIPLSAAWAGKQNGRSPLFAVSPAWSDEENDHGVPGTIAALTEQVALRSTHGSASPYDLHALAVASGPSLDRKSVV